MSRDDLGDAFAAAAREVANVDAATLKRDILRTEVGYRAAGMTDDGEFHAWGTVQDSPETVAELYPAVHGPHLFVAEVTTTYVRHGDDRF